tara:strand:- start:1338 stop:1697 length:360 start_codon:yes stop_codon:yes gene_type:complete
MNWLITLLIILFGFVIFTNFTKTIIEPLKSSCAAKSEASAKVDALDNNVDDFKKDIVLRLSVLQNKMDGLKSSQDKNFDETGTNRRKLKKMTDRMQRKLKEKEKDMDKNTGELNKLNTL